MNSTKEKCLALHAEGYSTRTIAKILGISKTTAHYHVSTPYLDQQQSECKSAQGEQKRRAVNSVCPFSPSCFTCTLRACRVSEWKAPLVNRLPENFDYIKEVEGA